MFNKIMFKQIKLPTEDIFKYLPEQIKFVRVNSDGSLVGFRTEPKIYEIKYEPSLIVRQQDEKSELNTNKEVLYNYNSEVYLKKWIASEGNKFTNGININYGIIYENSDTEYNKLILNR